MEIIITIIAICLGLIGLFIFLVGLIVTLAILLSFEGFAFVAYVRWLVCRQAMTQNPCCAYVAVNLG